MMVQEHQICLLLGSNIQPEKNLALGLDLLRSQVKIIRVSSVWETSSVGASGPDFLNMALLAATALEAGTFKEKVIRPLEKQLGRLRVADKNAPRTIDLDISLWDDDIFDYGEKPWHIPDPYIMRFAHVVIPLAEITPEYVHPVEKVTLATIAGRFAAVKFQRLPFPFDA